MAENSAAGPDPGYLGWAKDELGVVLHHELRLSSTPGREERGVFCEEDIPADTIVVSVPWEVGAEKNIFAESASSIQFFNFQISTHHANNVCPLIPLKNTE